LHVSLSTKQRKSLWQTLTGQRRVIALIVRQGEMTQ
jgi:hypothetical protein